MGAYQRCTSCRRGKYFDIPNMESLIMAIAHGLEKHVSLGLLDRFLFGLLDVKEELPVVWDHLVSCSRCNEQFMKRWPIRVLQKAAGLAPPDLSAGCVDFTQLHITEASQADILASIWAHTVTCIVCRMYFMLSLGLVEGVIDNQRLLFPLPGQKADKSLFDLEELESVF